MVTDGEQEDMGKVPVILLPSAGYMIVTGVNKATKLNEVFSKQIAKRGFCPQQ